MKRHKWKRKAARTHQCEHCGWRKRYRLADGKKGAQVWWERDNQKVTKLPPCTPVAVERAASVAKAYSAATRAEIDRLTGSLVDAEVAVCNLQMDLAAVRQERDAQRAAHASAELASDHWRGVVTVLRRRLSEQAAIIRGYENDGDPRRNVTAGLLLLEQRQREVQCDEWRRMLNQAEKRDEWRRMLDQAEKRMLVKGDLDRDGDR